MSDADRLKRRRELFNRASRAASDLDLSALARRLDAAVDAPSDFSFVTNDEWSTQFARDAVMYEALKRLVHHGPASTLAAKLCKVVVEALDAIERDAPSDVV